MNNMTKYAEYESRKKSYGIAYLLWILFGWLGLQRFYVGDTFLGVCWCILTYLTFTDPVIFFKIYIAVSLVEWVAIGLRVKEINQEALVWLKHSDELEGETNDKLV